MLQSEKFIFPETSDNMAAGNQTRLLRIEENITTIEDAQKLIKQLREKIRSQSLQFLAWHRKFKIQEELLMRIMGDQNEQLHLLSTKLLLFEAKLLHKQRDIGILLSQRENIINKQQQIIKMLQSRLTEAGLELNCNETNLDPMNDSDSAIIMEDDDTYVYSHRANSVDSVTVMRSISDVLDIPTNSAKLLSSSSRRSNGFLRRPEILETVYSVEEDGDADGMSNENETNLPRSSVAADVSNRPAPFRKLERLDNVVYQSSETISDEDRTIQDDVTPVTTFNRVMSSNHRSVTKPKDVKYRRINKAKSKSLEELRGRLKNWVEKGNKFTFSFDHST